MSGKGNKQNRVTTRSNSQDRNAPDSGDSSTTTMQHDDTTPLSELTVGDLKQLLSSIMQPIQNQIDSLVDRLNDIEQYKDTVDNVQTQIKSMQEQTLPQTASHINSMVEALALQNLDINMHRRKFNLIVQGLTGDAGEDSDVTRKEIISMAKNKLKIKPTPERPLNEHQLAACHRLSPDADSGVIVRFNDLRERDRWLSHAKNLAGTNISLGIDVPPCLRKAKTELMDIRKALPPDAKKRAYVKHLPKWPYLQLNQANSAPTHHTFSKSHIVCQALGFAKDMCTLKLTPNG